MAYTVVDKGSKHFNIILRNGGGGTFTGLGFQPDLVWQKARSSASSHYLHDAVRGVQKALFTNSTSSETTYTDQLTSFDTDGFTVNAGGDWGSGTTVVDWCWKAGNSAGSSNTQGSITSTVSANTTSGFSIVSYTGNGSNSTVGHGLGVAPKFIIFKNRSSATGWACYNVNIGASKYLALNETIEAQTATGVSNSTDPTSSVFSIGTADRVNTNGDNYIAYCFAEVKGFSKFGSFVGNGSTDGSFVYTGFKPAFVMIKSSSTGGAGYNWGMWDNKRDGYNVNNNDLRANLNNAESTDDSIDLLSNGFKIRTDSGGFGGGSGVTYIYMCFAESPFTSSKGIATTAR